MDRGTYAVTSSGLAQLRKLEIVNNNMANINTPGFKREILLADQQPFEETMAQQFENVDPFARGDHQRASGVVNIRAVTDFTSGAIKQTGNPLDVALLKENQFFAIGTPDGEQYTRAGNFTLDSDGTVVTADGMAVLGDGGAITTDGPSIAIDASGTVRSGPTQFGRVRVVEFTDTSRLERAGNNRFKLGEGAAAPAQVETKLEPSALEMANVSAITSVVEMMTANRGFEMYTRTAQAIDQMNQAAISQVGRPRN